MWTVLLMFLFYLHSINMQQIPYPSVGWVMYTIPNCAYCIKAKELFHEKKQVFVVVDCDSNEASDKKKFADALAEYTNNTRTFPMIFHKGKFIGGFVTLKTLLDQPVFTLTEDF